MAERVFLHVGAPKTGTTFLQQVMLANRTSLLEQGVLFAAGKYPNDRIWAMEIARGNDLSAHPKPHAAGAWERVKGQIRRHPGDAVLSHEFLGACDESRVRWVVDELAPAEVHVVFTARDYVRQAAAAWQERVKSVRPVELDKLSLDEDNGTPLWSWRTLDTNAILGRWATAVPVACIHVVTVPQSTKGDSPLWPRFASVIGIDPDSCKTSGLYSNQSLGLVEAELVRRVDERLPAKFRDLKIGNRWVRNLLAQSILAKRVGERITVAPEYADELIARSSKAADAVLAGGYHVVGNIDELVPESRPAPSRRPTDVSDAELLDAAVDAVTGLLSYLEDRRLGERVDPRRGQRGADATGPAVRPRSLLAAVRASDALSVRLARRVLASARRRRPTRWETHGR